MKYKNVFIDLDRTLWDFETNSNETLRDIFYKYKIENYCIFEDFYKFYRTVNEYMWKDYRDKKISKNLLSWKRFYVSILHFGFDDESVAKNMGEDYITLSPLKTRLFPYTHELLKYLKSKYKLYLVTNGFKEVQYVKIRNCDLEKYFDKVYTSEEVGCNKPDIEYFRFVLAQTNSIPEESIIIGDDIEVDIKGAAQVEIDTLWCNFVNQTSDFKPDFEVKTLTEVLSIL